MLLQVHALTPSNMVHSLLSRGKLYSAELAARELLTSSRLNPSLSTMDVAAAYHTLATILLDEADLFESIDSSFLWVAQKQRVEALVMLKRAAAWSAGDEQQGAAAAIQQIQGQFSGSPWMQKASRKLGLSQYARGAFRHFNAIAQASGAAALQGRRLSAQAAAEAHARFQDAALRESFQHELNTSAPSAFLPVPPMLGSSYTFHRADALFQFGYKQEAADLLCNGTSIILTPASFDGTFALAALHPDVVLQAATLLRVCGVAVLRPRGASTAKGAFPPAAGTKDASTDPARMGKDAVESRGGLAWLDHPWGLPAMAAVARVSNDRFTSPRLLGSMPNGTAWGTVAFQMNDEAAGLGEAAPPLDVLAEGVLMKRLLHCFNTSDLQRLAEAEHPTCTHAHATDAPEQHPSTPTSVADGIALHPNRSSWAPPVAAQLRRAALLMSAVAHPRYAHWDSTATGRVPQKLLWAANPANGTAAMWHVALGSHVACAQEMLLPLCSAHTPMTHEGSSGTSALLDIIQGMALSAGLLQCSSVCPEAAVAMARRTAAVALQAGDLMLLDPALQVQHTMPGNTSATLLVSWQRQQVHPPSSHDTGPQQWGAAQTTALSDGAHTTEQAVHALGLALLRRQGSLCSGPSSALGSHDCLAAVPWTAVEMSPAEGDVKPPLMTSPSQVDSVLSAAMGA